MFTSLTIRFDWQSADRLAVSIAGLLLLVAPSAEAKAPEYLRGLWTHLLYEERPEESRRLPLIYAGTWNTPDKFEQALQKVVERQTPAIIDIEKTQNAERRLMRLDSTINTAEQIAADSKLMIAKLSRAQALEISTGLWSIPSQNGMAHAWKEKDASKVQAYRQRLKEAAPVIEQQDFLTIQLYFPATHQEHRDKSWPVEQAIQRGQWFLDEHEHLGKPNILFVSPQWGGVGEDSVPPEWLDSLVRHFVNREEAVCIWGGLRQPWRAESPMGKTLLKLMDDYPPSE